MTAQNKTTLKGYFNTNDKPTEVQFANFIDTVGGSILVAANDAPDVIKGRADYVCDGTDDNVEIQSAVNGYKCVYLSEGNFSLSAAVVVAGDNVSLIGSGFGTVVTLVNSLSIAAAITVTGDYAILESFKADSNGSNQSGGLARNIYLNGSIGSVVRDVFGVNARSHGIDIEGCQDVTVERCIIREFDTLDAANDGISITNAQNNIIISRNIISQSVLGSVSQSGIEAEDGAYNLIIDSNIISGMHNGINVHGHEGNPGAYDIVICKNTIDSVGDYGIRVNGLSGTYLNGIIVVSNIIHDCGDSGILLAYAGGIVYGNNSHDNDYGIYASNCTNLLITANRAENNTTGNVALGTGNSGVTKASNIGDDI